MQKRRLLAMLLVLVSLVWMPFASSATLGAAVEADDSSRVYVISVEDAVEAGLSTYMERAFGIVGSDPSAKLVIVEIDTPGGVVSAAQSIRRTIEACPVETVALVRGGAISAGTYIAMSCDKIAMQPGTTIGDVEPRYGTQEVDEKVLSYWRAEMSSLAEAHGRDKEIARAMVDKTVVIEGLSKEGDLLTLTAQEAMDVGYADYLVSGRAALKELYGLEDAVDTYVEISTAERVARFITNPSIAPFILMIGIAGVIIEVLTAGFGVAGIVGGAFLITYFAGHMVAGLTGWGAVLLFVAGIILVLVEALIPGFGVAGISGILCFMASVILMAPSLQAGVQSFAIALVGSITLIALAMKFLSGSRYWDRLSLQLSMGKEEGYISQVEDYSVYVGRKGMTMTTLRPSGIVVLDDGKRLDVVSEGEFVEKDKPVVIARTDGPVIYAARDVEM